MQATHHLNKCRQGEYPLRMNSRNGYRAGEDSGDLRKSVRTPPCSPQKALSLTLSISLADVPLKMQEGDIKQTWEVFAAGGLAGGLARTVGSPFSRITIILQTNTLYSSLPPTHSGRPPSQWRRMVTIARDIFRYVTTLLTHTYLFIPFIQTNSTLIVL